MPGGIGGERRAAGDDEEDADDEATHRGGSGKVIGGAAAPLVARVQSPSACFPLLAVRLERAGRPLSTAMKDELL